MHLAATTAILLTAVRDDDARRKAVTLIMIVVCYATWLLSSVQYAASNNELQVQKSEDDHDRCGFGRKKRRGERGA